MENHRPTVFQVSLYPVLEPVFLVTSESAAEMYVSGRYSWAVLTKIIVIAAVVFIMC